MITSSSHLIVDPQLILSIKETADTYFLDARQNNGIDHIREFNHWLLKKPFADVYKIGFIKSADYLTTEAQNSLLKSLEEPPKSTYIILTVQNISKLLPTVRSRCFTHETETEVERLPFASLLRRNVYQSEPPSIPNLTDIKSALLEAEHLALKYKRDQIITYINDWVKELVNKGGMGSITYADKLLAAKEMLTHNTNIQLTLEATFIDIVSDNQ